MDFDPVAVYAALVASAALGWQVYSWRAKHATLVRVEASWGLLDLGMAGVSGPMCLVTVYNRSAHPLSVVGVGLVLAKDRSTSIPILSQPRATVPGTLPPRSQGVTWGPIAGLAETLREHGLPPGTELRGYATDGTGVRHLARKTLKVA